MAPPKGPFEPILPLDRMILEKLPNEGTMFANAYPIGTTVVEIVKQIGVDGITSDTISTRVRVMRMHELVVSVKQPKAHGTLSWQITKKGRDFVADLSDQGADDGNS